MFLLRQTLYPDHTLTLQRYLLSWVAPVPFSQPLPRREPAVHVAVLSVMNVLPVTNSRLGVCCVKIVCQIPTMEPYYVVYATAPSVRNGLVLLSAVYVRELLAHVVRNNVNNVVR